MRGSQLLLLCLLASGTAGCLLFTDPINNAPSVTITAVQDATQLVRSKSAQFTAIPVATASTIDPDQSTESLTFGWYQGKTCDKALSGQPAASSAGFVTFSFQPKDLGPGCVAVVVTDTHGATATATLRYEVVDQAPVAIIKIPPTAGQPTPVDGQPYPLALYSKIALSGKDSYDPDNEDLPLLTPIWSVYAANGTQVLLPGCPDKDKGAYVCTFATATPGTYHVKLVVSTNDKKSDPAVQLIQVAEDQLPNIVLDSAQPLPPTSPSDAPLLLFANLDNTFTINRVEDDGDSYPSADPTTANPAGFVWFWRDYPPSGTFTRWTGSGPTFTIPAGPTRSQRSLQVRVEYHDRVTACQPRTPGCDAVFAACDPNATICYSPDLRVEWVTWTVTFR
jgi:hypothetical protein